MQQTAAYKPMADQAYDFLYHKIVTCEYPPGQELYEKELLEETGFGRTPLREALLSLQKDGLLEIFPRKGMRISPFTEKQVKDFYQTRKLLEPLVAEEYTSLYSKEQLLDFQSQFEKSCGEENYDRFILDYRFHTYLISITGNDILINMYQTLMKRQIHLAMYTAQQISPDPGEDFNQHTAIIDALLRENKKDIRDSITLHLNFSLVRSMKSLRIQ